MNSAHECTNSFRLVRIKIGSLTNKERRDIDISVGIIYYKILSVIIVVMIIITTIIIII